MLTDQVLPRRFLDVDRTAHVWSKDGKIISQILLMPDTLQVYDPHFSPWDYKESNGRTIYSEIKQK